MFLSYLDRFLLHSTRNQQHVGIRTVLLSQGSYRCRFLLPSQLLEQYFDSDFGCFSSGLFGFPAKLCQAFGTFLFFLRLFRFRIPFLRCRFRTGISRGTLFNIEIASVKRCSVTGIAAIPITTVPSSKKKQRPPMINISNQSLTVFALDLECRFQDHCTKDSHAESLFERSVALTRAPSGGYETQYD